MAYRALYSYQQSGQNGQLAHINVPLQKLTQIHVIVHPLSLIFRQDNYSFHWSKIKVAQG